MTDFSDPAARAAFRDSNAADAAAYNGAVLAEVTACYSQIGALVDELVVTNDADAQLRDELKALKKLADHQFDKNIRPLIETEEDPDPEA
ncbi:hypothetical protein [Maricaulis maris]|uniref:hypothetical protein n=1 Tax=Maricaulis maris TaxID=74318 RepID=UPI003B8E1A81